MFHKFALLSLFASSSLVLGCRDPDFKPADLSGNGSDDMAMTAPDLFMRVYKDATVNQIDTNPFTGGSFNKGTAVKLTGLIVLTPTRFFESNGKMRCDYEVIAQDPLCMTPPCGIEVIVEGYTKAMVSDQCKFANMSGTVLATSMVGDKIDIAGVVDTFPQNPPASDAGALMSILMHEVKIDSLTKTGTGTVTPTVVTADTSNFQNYQGTDWAKYEGMLVKLQVNAGKLMVTKNDGMTKPFQFYTDPGNTNWGTNYDSLFQADGGMTFPTVGRQFSSITGAVRMNFGGSVNPRFMSDFVP